MADEYDNNQASPQDKIIVQHQPDDDQTVSTRDIPDHVLDIVEPIGAEGANTILLMLPGQISPLTFVDTESIILGRHDPSTGMTPTVDLIPYFGKSLGVSRRHAEIFLQGGRFYLRDLHSANGTWLNNKQILIQPQPLKSGDQIRLGELLIVVFLSEKEIQVNESSHHFTGQHTLYVQYTNLHHPLPPNSISIDFINDTLVGFLHALNEVQMAIFAINNHEVQPITLRGLRFIDTLNIIEIQLYIHPQVLFFLRDTVQKYLSKNEQITDEALLVMLYRQSAQDILENLTASREGDEHYATHVKHLQKELQKLFGFHLKIVNME